MWNILCMKVLDLNYFSLSGSRDQFHVQAKVTGKVASGAQSYVRFSLDSFKFKFLG